MIKTGRGAEWRRRGGGGFVGGNKRTGNDLPGVSGNISSGLSGAEPFHKSLSALLWLAS